MNDQKKPKKNKSISRKETPKIIRNKINGKTYSSQAKFREDAHKQYDKSLVDFVIELTEICRKHEKILCVYSGKIVLDSYQAGDKVVIFCDTDGLIYMSKNNDEKEVLQNIYNKKL